MSQRQPIYRRPSWAQHEKSFRTYMKKDLAADRSPGHDYGVENFSFDDAYLSEWQAPDHVTDGLPEEMKARLSDWQAAGAAVCTALQRMGRLYNESLHRGYPERRSSHLSRRPSGQSSVVDSPITSPLSPMPMYPGTVAPYDRTTSSPLATIPQRQILGMESPPFTPLDGTCPGTPFNCPNDPTNPKLADLQLLSKDLTPLSRRDSALSSGIATPAFDESAWETYLNTYRAELDDIQHQALVRVKGYGHAIEKLRIETGQEAEFKDAVGRFSEWWLGMKAQVADYEEKVRNLEVPDLDFVRMERMAKGMSV